MGKLNRTYITILLILGALEFFIATVFIFSLAPDPKNAFLLGYSVSRWAVAIITIGCGVISIYLARRTYQQGLPHKLETTLAQNISTLRSVSIFMFLVGVIIIISSPDHLGRYAEYFERLRPLLIIVTTLPFQFFFPIIFKQGAKPGTAILKHVLTAFLVLALLAAFIALTRIGIDPDTRFWNNMAGVPLTMLQLMIVLLMTFSGFQTVIKASTSIKVSPITVDICIALFIYIAGIWIWTQTPMLKHFNALRPAPPAFQYFPNLDARAHDLGALSILSGYGIYYGGYTDKPLYMVLLSFLHRLAGDDYNRISLFHLYIMGFILPALFWLGKQIHSRHLGIAIALIILIRQRNAILLAHLLGGTNPRLLLTEIPALLGLIVLCIISFWWLKKNGSNMPVWPYALLAGGTLGALSLIRLNPIGLLPVILLVSAIALRKMYVNWFRQLLIFMLGFLLVLTPWVLTGQDANGNSYMWVKFLDVINVRYFSAGAPIEKTDQVYASGAINTASPSNLHTTESYQTVDTHSFPGFVINHALHNAVTAFLALPDSLFSNEQVLKNLMQRPYLDQTATWHGELQARQIPFFALNLFLLALGLGWSWNRWKWAGIFPVLIFIGYIIVLGFARTSGSRYIVPVDWILFLYYSIGIIVLLEKFTNAFENISMEIPLLESNRRARPTLPVFAVFTVLLLSALIPIAQLPRITQNLPACENKINNPDYPQLSLLKGKALYPYLEKKTFSFVFLTCSRTIEIRIKGFNVPLQNGQAIVVGLSKKGGNKPESIFLEENSTLVQVWTNE